MKTTLDAASPFQDGRYRTLYESSFDGVLLTELDGRILSANPAACTILGHTEEQLKALTRLDLVVPNDPRLCALLAEREKTGRYQGELTMVRADGTTFEAEVASVVFEPECGTITTMIIRDVSERKRSEARLREQAQWLDMANEAIIASNPEHRIIYWNAGAERMGGRKGADMVGRSLNDLLNAAGISDPEVLAAASQMTDWRGTLSCRHLNGTIAVVTVSVTVLRDSQGQATGRLCICTDVTEQTQIKDKFERALRLQSIGMLAAGVAHDFNNILTPIGMSVAMLRDRISYPEDIELLEGIQACVFRGSSITRQILGFAQGAGSEARTLEVSPILREVAGIVRETFPRSIALKTNSSSDLWQVMGNSTQIHQVLLNLCVNARDAMPQGGELRLSGRNCLLDEESAALIEGARKGAWLVLSVEDTGTGISPEDLPRMWEPFFTTKSIETGTGLGLSTVRSIVESHAGFISVDTAAGRGTAFRIFLPAITSSTLRQGTQVQGNILKGNGERILVVEDQSWIRELTKTALVKAGYRVTTSVNGVEALGMFTTDPEKHDLVLTDIDMPELDGAKLALAIGAMRPTLPVVAMSGLSSKSADVDPAQFSGGFLQKPFTVDDLYGTVRKALERYRAIGLAHRTGRGLFKDNEAVVGS